MLSRATYLQVLERDADSFVALLREGDLSTPVADCPGWDLGDLARHLGGIHRWAHGIVTTGSPGEEPDGPREQSDLVTWFEAGAGQLVDALTTTDPSTPVWTFGPKPRLVEFWVRRQPHETSLHLGDARRALGLPHRVEVEFAADGVDEVVTMLTPRQIRLERIPPIQRGVRLELIDVADRSQVLAGDCTDPDARTLATVSGSAELVLLALWRRTDPATLTIEGDEDAVRSLFALALTP